MSAKIVSVENHKNGSFYIDVHLSGVGFERFKSMIEVNEFLAHWKDIFDSAIDVTLKQFIIMQRKEFAYESNYTF